MSSFKNLAHLNDDGLKVAEVGSWSEEKYRLVEAYSSLFCRSMRRKWGSLVYLDIFAGPGYARFQGTSRIVAASPLIALGLDDKFSSYIFSEADPTSAQALQTRCARDFTSEHVRVIPGDANALADQIVRAMPMPSKANTVLGFCFVDPYKMGNLQFSTIEKLAARFMDFLVLIPSGMDAHRNEQRYVSTSNTTVDDFVGDSRWRTRWEAEKAAGKQFEKFIVEEFGRSMTRLGYADPGLEKAAIIRSDTKNLLLYRLVLYSKNKLGGKFWDEAMKYTNPQTGFEGF